MIRRWLLSILIMAGVSTRLNCINVDIGCCPCEPCAKICAPTIPIVQCGVNDCCLSNKDACDDDCASHTFFVPRDITTNNLLQHNLSLFWWYHDVLCEDPCIWGTVQATPFYQRSSNRNDIARFFLPCKQCEIEVKEDGSGDIGSLWLNLIAAPGQDFDACVSIRPRRTVVGALFNFRFNLSRYICNTWLAVTFAAIRAKHDLNLCEAESPDPGVACDLTNVCEALNQPDWCFGKFSPCSLVRKGIDNVQIKLGYDWFFCNTDHVSPYIVGVAPTGKRQCPEFIYEPIVGGKHGAIGAGVIGDYTIWESDYCELTLLTDFKYLYWLRACQTRSFDLCKNGEWSRYLQVVNECARSNSLPGINVFTQDVRVTPRSNIDWWLALHAQYCQWNLEIGYDLWWRQKERVELCCCDIPPCLGIYDMVGDCNINPVSASCAEICQTVDGSNPAPSDATFVTLDCCDLNLDSGAMPRALSNTIYAALGYDGCLYGYPVLAGIGGSFEFGRKCDALDNWTVWVKLGLAF